MCNMDIPKCAELTIVDLEEVNTVVSCGQSQLPLQVLKNPEEVVYDDKPR